MSIAFLRFAAVTLAAGHLACAGSAGAGPLPRTETAARICPAGTLMEAKALAERAARVFVSSGRTAAFTRYQDPAGPFVRGDLYVFVVDLNGIVIMNAGFPEVVGSDISRLQTQFARVIRNGRGWVGYRWYNPCSRRMEQKKSYLVRVGNLIIGVGAYGSLSV